MATLEELARMAEAADAAGNAEDVQFLLGEIDKLQSKSKEAPKQAKPKGTLSGAARTLAQGITLGFGDEAEAYIRSTFSGEDREELLKEIRKDIRKFGVANPKTALALEVAGGVLPSLVPAGLAARGVLAGAKGAGLARTAMQGAAAGAAEGAIAGFGAGEGGVENRLKSAAIGGTFGGVLGGAAPFAIAGAADVGARAFDGLGLSGANRAAKLAERRVGKAIRSEGLTPEQALAQLQAGQAAGAPMTLADIGEATRGAAYAAQAVPNPQRTGVMEQLIERSVEQGGRIADTTAEKMNASGSYGLDYLDDIFEQQAEKFKPLYQAAEKDIPAAPFRKYADRKVFKKAFKAIQDRADTLGEEPIEDLAAALAGDTVPTTYLQKIAQGLDRVIKSNTDSFGKLNDKAKDVLTVRNQFKEQIGNLNDAFKKADAQYADYSDMVRAFDVGEAFENLSEQEFARKVAKMKPDEIESMKAGMITKIRNIASGSDRTDYVQRLFGSPKRRNALRKAFPDEASFETFEDYMKAEAAIQRTQRRVLGGSDTQRNLEEMASQGIDPATMLQLFTGGRGEALRQGAGMLSTRMQGIGAPVAEEMSKMLFAATPAAQRQAVQRITGRELQDAARRQQLPFRPELYGGILGAAVGLNTREY